MRSIRIHFVGRLRWATVLSLALWFSSSLPAANAPQAGRTNGGTIFCLGKPDGTALEFGCADTGWQSFQGRFPRPVIFTVGKDKPAAWPYIHPSTHDAWAGGKSHTFTLGFTVEALPSEPLHLILGLASAHSSPSLLTVSLNGTNVATRRVPAGSGNGEPDAPGGQTALTFPLPAGSVRPGANTLALTLTDGSWLIYDYVYLGASSQPPSIQATDSNLIEKFRAGPMAQVGDIIFAVRKIIPEHWYANFGYYASDQGRSYFGNSHKLYRDGARLCRLDLATRQVTALLDDPRGGIRDPQVHYDARKILFSYRPGGAEHYHLYEINADGAGLRQLTDGDCDDIEPTYLPDGGIVFVSSRCHRWVNCWVTQVAVLYRCDADGKHIRPISSNNEHDNTPWPLPDGRILYTRWEYIDRSQVDYHHLWIVDPDGTGQTVFYGNLHPGTVMIDAKPIPGSDKIVASFNPGHGQTEHEGTVTVVDPRAGPDARNFARRISRRDDFRDPWAFSEDCFLAARQQAIVLMDDSGATQELFRLSPDDIKAGLHVHEPRPLVPRLREPCVAPRSNPASVTGRLMLANVYDGRQMAGVQRGEIKKLLVLESLPKPINFTGGMDPLSYGGTFTLERVLGTVPVEADGSAYFEAPALRSLFFVALDEKDLSVKRMQSFVTVQPGETAGCVGCHEQRTRTPPSAHALSAALATRRPPSRIEPIRDVPEVLDFPRDIQPVLDALCADCHGYEKTARGGPYAGRLILSGDHGPMFSHSYFMLTVRRLFSDGRNEPRSNYAPRTLGSSASRILRMLDGSHYGVKAGARQQTLLRLWIESGAPYPGTYAALGSGMVGGYAQNAPVHTDFDWPSTKAGAEVIARRCAACHRGNRALPRAIADELDISFWRFALDDPRLQFSRHKLFNLSRPEKSLLLLAPLAQAAGGFGICATNAQGTPAGLFTGTDDPDYQKLLAMVAAGKSYLDQIKRFDMPEFRPRLEWVREMKRYGVLAAEKKPTDLVDIYAVERKYWESLWYRVE